MKRMVYILVFISLPVLGVSQIFQPLPNFYRPIDSSTIQKAKEAREEKVDFGLTVGSGFSSFGGHSMLNSYVAPSIEYQVNPNLSLNFTGVISNLNQSPFGNASAFQSSPEGLMPLNTSNNYSFSAGGLYQPNEKMYIRAQGQYAQNPLSPFSLYPNQNRQSFDSKSFSLGMGYKISEEASIDFQFQFSNGNNPYHSPYSPYNRYNSFNRSPLWW